MKGNNELLEIVTILQDGFIPNQKKMECRSSKKCIRKVAFDY